MPDCPYCERSFADESEIRKHLYEDTSPTNSVGSTPSGLSSTSTITTSKKATMPLVRSKTQRKR